MIKVYQWTLKEDGSIAESQAAPIIGRLMMGSEELSKKIWNDEITGFEFKLVATVHTDKMDDAFRLTNSIDDNWYEVDNDLIDIEPSAAIGCRSTSVGDIVQNENGEVWVVANFGFTQLFEVEPKQSRGMSLNR